MNKKQWLLADAFIVLSALNAYVVYRYGVIGFLEEAVSSVVGVAVLVDLTIAVSLIGVWMWNDAKRRGMSPLPYLVASLFLGSLGPLAYLLRTSGDAANEAPAVGAHLAAPRR